MYLAKYLTPDGIEWRTVYADSLSYAITLANRNARKGWIMAGVTMHVSAVI